MNILIVESEIYLAQSISSKMHDFGYRCEIVTSVNEALKLDAFEIVLLSSTLSGQNIYPVIEKYKNSIIILLVSYVSSDTVINPIKAGARDYILKPFMIDELVRKIEYLVEFERLKIIDKSISNYLKFNLGDSFDENQNIKLNPPLFIKTNNQKMADGMVLSYLKKQKNGFELLVLPTTAEKISVLSKNRPIYIPNFHVLKKSEKSEFFEIIKNYPVIITTTDSEDELPIKTITLLDDNNRSFINGLISIDDFIKMMLINYQDSYPDTELSKKLGISRKSLWEKRRKFGIYKKK